MDAPAPPGREASLLQVMSDAILAVASEPRVDRALRHLVESAAALAGARYAALGIPDETGDEFSQFIYTGISDELAARIGPLPRKHGLLAAMLTDTRPFLAPDIQDDPRFEWWPPAHPAMTSFLGVPIVSKGRVIGAFYLTDSQRSPEFTADDQATIEMLAAHAAVAIENARLYERSRELSVIEERNRLARELHDSVVQILFSTVLTAEAALASIDHDPATAKKQIADVRDLARGAAQEMRSLIFELRPAELEADGLAPTLRKHIDVLRRVTGKPIDLHDEGYIGRSLAVERELFRIAQEALNNAIRHAQAGHIAVELGGDGNGVRLAVTDDGVGFDPDNPVVRAQRLGLTSMAERAEALGGALTITSAPGNGVRVELEVPGGPPPA